MNLQAKLDAAEKATAGPWSVDPFGAGARWNIGTAVEDVALASQVAGDSHHFARDANAAFIADARTNYPAALRALLEIQAECEARKGEQDYVNQLISPETIERIITKHLGETK